MVVGGYAQGLYSDESFVIDVESRQLRKKDNLPIEIFPFAMPTVSDTVNRVVYTVDW
jgi:hypothetical protein